MNGKRSDKNSATSAVAGFVGAINDRIPLSAGVDLRSEAELIFWHEFIRACARSDRFSTQMTRGQKICAFIEAYLCISQGALIDIVAKIKLTDFLYSFR